MNSLLTFQPYLFGGGAELSGWPSDGIDNLATLFGMVAELAVPPVQVLRAKLRASPDPEIPCAVHASQIVGSVASQN